MRSNNRQWHKTLNSLENNVDLDETRLNTSQKSIQRDLTELQGILYW